MGQCDLLHTRVPGELDYVFDRAMAPSDFGWVFGCRVLSIMDEKIRVLQKLGMPQVLPGDLPLPGCETARIGLVVARVHDDKAVCLQAIAQREGGVVEILRRYLDVADIEDALDQVVLANRGAELVERDGKICVLHLACERLAQRLAEALGAIDVPIAAVAEKRSEERDALDMIPMGVTDEDMPALDVACDQLLSERMSACSAIDHDQRAARRTHLDAGVPP